MKTNNQKHFPTVPVVTLVAILLVVSTTLAMFFSQVQVNRLFSISNFTATGEVGFASSVEASAISTTASADSTGRGISVDVADPDEPNYIGKLRVNVKYAGNGVGLIRVRIVEEWSTEEDANGVRQVMPYSIKLPYTIANEYPSNGSGNLAKWYDNRESDYRFYFATPVNCTSSSERSIPLITGIDTSAIDLNAIDSSTVLHIRVEADIVQVNRYPQFWGTNALPWSNPVSVFPEQTSVVAQNP